MNKEKISKQLDYFLQPEIKELATVLKRANKKENLLTKKEFRELTTELKIKRGDFNV